jgi:hypothetical protein
MGFAPNPPTPPFSKGGPGGFLKYVTFSRPTFLLIIGLAVTFLEDEFLHLLGGHRSG